MEGSYSTRILCEKIKTAEYLETLALNTGVTLSISSDGHAAETFKQAHQIFLRSMSSSFLRRSRQWDQGTLVASYNGWKHSLSSHRCCHRCVVFFSCLSVRLPRFCSRILSSVDRLSFQRDVLHRDCIRPFDRLTA